jgi:hypothetical protein
MSEEKKICNKTSSPFNILPQMLPYGMDQQAANQVLLQNVEMKDIL